MRLKDLLMNNNSYIVEYDYGNGYHLFIEGLDEIGCSFGEEDFNVDYVDCFCIELIKGGECVVATWDDLKPNLDTPLDYIKNWGLDKIKEEELKHNRAIQAIRMDELLKKSIENESLYYDKWLTVYPDGETLDQATEDFGDEESFIDLVRLFIRVLELDLKN